MLQLSGRGCLPAMVSRQRVLVNGVVAVSTVWRDVGLRAVLALITVLRDAARMCTLTVAGLGTLGLSMWPVTTTGRLELRAALKCVVVLAVAGGSRTTVAPVVSCREQLAGMIGLRAQAVQRVMPHLWFTVTGRGALQGQRVTAALPCATIDPAARVAGAILRPVATIGLAAVLAVAAFTVPPVVNLPRTWPGETTVRRTLAAVVNRAAAASPTRLLAATMTARRGPAARRFEVASVVGMLSSLT